MSPSKVKGVDQEPNHKKEYSSIKKMRIALLMSMVILFALLDTLVFMKTQRNSCSFTNNDNTNHIVFTLTYFRIYVDLCLISNKKKKKKK